MFFIGGLGCFFTGEISSISAYHLNECQKINSDVYIYNSVTLPETKSKFAASRLHHPERNRNVFQISCSSGIMLGFLRLSTITWKEPCKCFFSGGGGGHFKNLTYLETPSF